MSDTSRRRWTNVALVALVLLIVYSGGFLSGALFETARQRHTRCADLRDQVQRVIDADERFVKVIMRFGCDGDWVTLEGRVKTLADPERLRDSLTRVMGFERAAHAVSFVTSDQGQLLP